MRAQSGNRGREQGGFTLVELLIVIIVLGLLAAIVVMAVGTSRKDAVISACKQDVKAIELSAVAINTKTGAYPVDATPSSPSSVLVPASGALLKSYPTSDSYVLKWVASTASIDVYDASGTTKAGTGTDGCAAL